MSETQKGIVMPKRVPFKWQLKNANAIRLPKCSGKPTKARRAANRAFGWVVGKHGIIRNLTKPEQRAQQKFILSSWL